MVAVGGAPCYVFQYNGKELLPFLDRNDVVRPAGRHRPVRRFEDTEKSRLHSETNCKFKNNLV